jgi:DNA-binding beta-propeller fold protein YncE
MVILSLSRLAPAAGLRADSCVAERSRRRARGSRGGPLLAFLGFVLAVAWTTGSRAEQLVALDVAALDRLVFVNDSRRPSVAVVDSRDDVLLGHIALDHVADVMAIARGRGLLVTASWQDPALHLVDLAGGAEMTRLPLGHSVEHFQLAGDESLVAVVDHEGDGLSLVSLEPPHHVRRVEGLAAPHNIVFAPDSKRLYATNLGSDRVTIVDLASGRLLEELVMPFEGVTDLSLTPDGNQALVLFGERDEVLMLDLKRGRTMALLTLGEAPFHAYPIRTGKRMIVPNNGDGTISIVSVDAAAETTRLEGARGMTAAVPAWFDSLAFLPSGEERRIVIVDLDSERLLGTIPLPGRPGDPVLGPLGHKLYVPLTDRGSLAVIDAAGRRLQGLIESVGEAPWIARMAGSLNHCH